MDTKNRIQRIFLIRHAESEGNVDKTVHQRMPDHAIGLSPLGLQQADWAGDWLVDYLEKNVRGHSSAEEDFRKKWFREPDDLKLRLWTSPYKRTRQTADAIAAHLERGEDMKWLESRAENILLCEQQFGLFDGVPDWELPIRFPMEHAHYKKCEDFEGRFWARMPMGESRFDVCQRVHQAFGTFQRDAERHGITNIAVVCHGVTMRAFKMMWMHQTPEWFEAEKNPRNCAIHLIQLKDGSYVDEGCIFEGF
jgi:2,3-bisphosphoglycerate-dependent phosphoglycerate mutase